MKMESPEIRHGQVLASSGERGLALTVTCILSIHPEREREREAEPRGGVCSAQIALMFPPSRPE